MGIVTHPKRYSEKLEALDRKLRETASNYSAVDFDLDALLAHLQSVSIEFGSGESDDVFLIHRRRCILDAVYEFALSNDLSSVDLHQIIDMFDEIGFTHPVRWIDMRSELIAKLRQEDNVEMAEKVRRDFAKVATKIVSQMQESVRHLLKE